jgi:winged helix DNA-binding protein
MALSGHRVLSRSRRRSEELELDGATLARATDVIRESVAGNPRTRKDLAAILERKRISVAGQRMPYVLMYAELTSAICSGPMHGKQHTYAAFEERVGPGIRMVGDEALAELARRYFTSRGPATLIDFVWWSGLNTADARHGLEMASDHLSSRSIDDRVYWFADDSAIRSGRRVDLVQCYDEVIISYSKSRDILQSTSVTFPVPGRVNGFTHVVLVDGRAAGHWRVVRRGTESHVETRIDRPLDRGEERALAGAVGRYRQFAKS